MPQPEHSLPLVLQRLASGEADYEQTLAAVESLLSGATVSSDETLRLDTDRQHRCGYPEVVYAPGKSDSALQAAFQSLVDHQQNCLATRCSEAQQQFLQQQFSEAIIEPDARTVRLQFSTHSVGKVIVVAAGTSDRPIALEAVETLKWMNVQAELLMDVGVAGPQRFLSTRHRLEGSDAVVVVAGMEGALPSVVGGWVSCPVIAVPTSVGYGAAFGGLAALLGMLNSCAANVTVVNIDAGFKGGYVAGMIARQVHDSAKSAKHE